MKKANIEKVEKQDEKIGSKKNQIKNQELYSAATAKGQDAQLLSFQAQEDEFPDRRGGRGGRGRGGRGGARPTGGRGQQTLRMDESSFPTLG